MDRGEGLFVFCDLCTDSHGSVLCTFLGKS